MYFNLWISKLITYTLQVNDNIKPNNLAIKLDLELHDIS